MAVVKGHTHVNVYISAYVWLTDTNISSREAKEWHSSASDFLATYTEGGPPGRHLSLALERITLSSVRINRYCLSMP